MPVHRQFHLAKRLLVQLIQAEDRPAILVDQGEGFDRHVAAAWACARRRTSERKRWQVAMQFQHIQ